MKSLGRIVEIMVGVVIAGMVLGWYMGAGGLRPGLVCFSKPGVTAGTTITECH